MALVTTTSQQTAPIESNAQPAFSQGDAAVLLMGALAGATLSKEAKKQYQFIYIDFLEIVFGDSNWLESKGKSRFHRKKMK